MTRPINHRTRPGSLHSITLTRTGSQVRTVARNGTTSPHARVRIRHMTSSTRQRSLFPYRVLTGVNTTSRIRQNMGRGARRNSTQNGSRHTRLRVNRNIRRLIPFRALHRRNRRSSRYRRGRRNRQFFPTTPAQLFETFNVHNQNIELTRK